MVDFQLVLGRFDKRTAAVQALIVFSSFSRRIALPIMVEKKIKSLWLSTVSYYLSKQSKDVHHNNF